MFFRWSASVTILFQSWQTSDSTWYFYLLSCVAVSTMTFLLEAARHAFHRMHTSNIGEVQHPSLKTKILSRCKEIVLYATYMALSYWVMLVIMTYNVGIFIAVIFGHCVGTCVFPRSLHRPGYVQTMVEPINACH